MAKDKGQRMAIYGLVIGAMVTIAGKPEVDKSTTEVRIVNSSGVEAVPGAVLLVNPGRRDQSQVFVADADGRVSIVDLRCEICAITAEDPRGLFLPKTTEFKGGTPSLSITLDVRPIVDVVRDPGSIAVTLAVYGPDRKPLVEQDVIFRPVLLTLQSNWVRRVPTNRSGLVSADLAPGKYVVAALIGTRPYEAEFEASRKASKQTLRITLAPSGT